jgi:hypothetical protein
VVFSGGAKGVEAVTDTQTYQLDMCTRVWSILPTKGQPPRSRQGHVLVAVDDKVRVYMYHLFYQSVIVCLVFMSLV